MELCSKLCREGGEFIGSLDVNIVYPNVNNKFTPENTAT